MKKIFFIALVIFGLVPFGGEASVFDRPAQIDVRVRSSYGKLLKDINFSVYHQVRDADGRWALGKRVASGNTGSLGKKTIKINVKPFVQSGEGNRFVFVVAPPETRQYPFYFWDIELNNGMVATKVFRLSSVKISLQRANRKPLAKARFNVLRKVLDNECHCEIKKVVHTATLSKGCVELYLSPGRYSLEVPSPDNKLVFSQDFTVQEEKRTVVDFYLSQLSIVFRGKEDRALVNKRFEIYQEDYTVDNQLIFGKRIGQYSTGPSGLKEVLLPPGRYLIKLRGDGGQDYVLEEELIAGENKIIDYRLSALVIKFYNYPDKNDPSFIKGNVYFSQINELGQPDFGKRLAGFKVPQQSLRYLYLPAGRYALSLNRKKFFNLEVLENKESVFEVRYYPGSGFRYKFYKPTASSLSVRLFAYGQKRINLREEKRRALLLKQELEKILGKGRLKTPASHWPTLVNAYVYGGYTPQEIADTILHGPQAVHPSIPAFLWRRSPDYQKYLKRKKFS